VSQDSARAADRIHDSAGDPNPRLFSSEDPHCELAPFGRRSYRRRVLRAFQGFDIKESGDDATLRQVCLTLGALALLASPAWAQQGRGGGMGGGAFFLMAPNVQKDLKLTDDQVGKVQDTLKGDPREAPG